MYEHICSISTWSIVVSLWQSHVANLVITMENASEPKKRRLSLSLSKHRFAIVSKETLADMNYKMPENSAKRSKWALKNLREWFDDYNKRNPDHMCPDDVLSPTCSKVLLNKWLCVYINETRLCTGELYPPQTVHSLLCGILRDIRAHNPTSNFLDKHETDFFSILQGRWTICLKVWDRLVLERWQILLKSCHARTKNKLWLSGVFDLDSLKGLLCAAFFLLWQKPLLAWWSGALES